MGPRLERAPSNRQVRLGRRDHPNSLARTSGQARLDRWDRSGHRARLGHRSCPGHRARSGRRACPRCHALPGRRARPSRRTRPGCLARLGQARPSHRVLWIVGPVWVVKPV